MSPFAPLQNGHLIVPLFGLLFVAVGTLNLVRPREMTVYQLRRRSDDGVEGRIEPTRARLVFTRLMGGVMTVVGVGLAFGLL